MNENKFIFLKKYGIDANKGIENVISSENYDELIKEYYNELPSTINLLGTYLTNKDLYNYAIKVHSLKSNSRTLGITNFGELCYKHELESKSGNIEYIKNDFQNLINSSKNIYVIINKYLSM